MGRTARVNGASEARIIAAVQMRRGGRHAVALLRIGGKWIERSSVPTGCNDDVTKGRMMPIRYGVTTIATLPHTNVWR